MQNRTIRKHLTATERGAIESMLREGRSIRYIANTLNKAPSSISKEISKHAITKQPKLCDCLNFKDCRIKKICNPDTSCRKDCRNCPVAKKYCPDYAKAYCEKQLDYKTGVCNQCSSKNNCHFEHRLYNSKTAQSEADRSLYESRTGHNVDSRHMDRINDVVTPLLKEGQSIYHIIQNHGHELGISESTLRRMINSCDLDARNIDLRMAVKIKPRRKKPQKGYKKMDVIKDGHKYKDYLRYIEEHDVSVVEMDCVEGKKTDNAALLTLHFKDVHLQIAVMLNEQTAEQVIYALDKIETSLGKELFMECFPLILTDNGHEFSDIEGMERSVYGGKRTIVFFCEPNRSDQKGSCECNHKHIRYVIPKGTTLEPYDQSDITLMMNHINSHTRKSLHGRTPYQFARAVMPEDFFILLGLEDIPADEVKLTPDLLKK